jgi:hypothetical protein
MVNWMNSRKDHRIAESQAHLAQQIALSITPGYCCDLNVVCFPQLGYLLACTLEHPEAYNINLPDGWELQVRSNM